MKKILGLLLAAIFTIGVLVGCGGTSNEEVKSGTAEARSLDEIKKSTSNINNSFMTVGNTINNTWISGMNDYLEKLNEVKSTLDTINATINPKAKEIHNNMFI